MTVMKPAVMKPANPHTQWGMTLIEIMVALTLSLVLVGGVIQMFLTSKQTYRMNEALARVQENGRFALESISRDLRMSGYQGCADPDTIEINSIVLNDPPTVSMVQSAVSGDEGSASADSITVRFGSSSSALLVNNTDPENATITISVNRDNIAQDDIVVLADCSSAHVVRATDVSTSPTTGDVIITYDASENNLAQLNKSYAPQNTQVMRFNEVTYSVNNTGRTSVTGSPIFALFRNGVEMVEGVEQLQVQYGERLSNGSMRYLDADAAALDVSAVQSVRVGLLVAAPEATSDQLDNKSYDIAGSTVAPAGTSGATVIHAADRNIRRAFNTTVSLRNRR